MATFIVILLTFGVLISESYLVWNHKKIDYIYINVCPFSPHFKTHIQLFTYTFIQHCYCIHRALFLSHTYIHDTSWPVLSQNYASVGVAQRQSMGSHELPIYLQRVSVVDGASVQNMWYNWSAGYSCLCCC